ncbi:MAG: hypothetical protein LBI69_00395 [Puniceicoccales bacterium]|jgi:hypothetical protein|nr:hypothetical protein [Puniceicoccales bacterium]
MVMAESMINRDVMAYCPDNKIHIFIEILSITSTIVIAMVPLFFSEIAAVIGLPPIAVLFIFIGIAIAVGSAIFFLGTALAKSPQQEQVSEKCACSLDAIPPSSNHSEIGSEPELKCEKKLQNLLQITDVQADKIVLNLATLAADEELKIYANKIITLVLQYKSIDMVFSSSKSGIMENAIYIKYGNDIQEKIIALLMKTQIIKFTSAVKDIQEVIRYELQLEFNEIEWAEKDINDLAAAYFMQLKDLRKSLQDDQKTLSMENLQQLIYYRMKLIDEIGKNIQSLTGERHNERSDAQEKFLKLIQKSLKFSYTCNQGISMKVLSTYDATSIDEFKHQNFLPNATIDIIKCVFCNKSI